ncbi:MAG: hypothetical protein HRU20_00620 [Pseudomonadales bacterium]|nr:hypothetical protein [Pseudomonadales bacterium]
MPNCNFYAVDKDYEEILDFVFKELDCKVYQKYSEPNTELVMFENTAEVMKYYDLANFSAATKKSANLVLWPTKASKNFRVTRVEATSKKAKSSSFRFRAEGWGVIQLELSGVSEKGLLHSHSNHNTEKLARSNEPKLKLVLGLVKSWNWVVVTNISGQLNNFIKYKSTKKVGSMLVMPCAAKSTLAK